MPFSQDNPGVCAVCGKGECLCTYHWGGRGKSPRGHVISVCYYSATAFGDGSFDIEIPGCRSVVEREGYVFDLEMTRRR